MTDIIPFSFEGHQVRSVMRDGDPWFVAADVCAALNIGAHRHALDKLDDDEKGCEVEVHTLGGVQKVAAITESGLYTLVLRSRDATTPGTLPHRFRRWVTSEVLPAIRKTGGYMVAAPDETPEQLALRALTVLQATVERQKAQLAEVQPKADALDRIATVPDGTLSITEAAKALQMRPKDLFSYLQQHGWIYKRAGSANFLGYQAKTTAGLMTHKITTVHRGDGSEKIVEQVLITPKGIARLAALIKPMGLVA
jgi:prophage antirepressor-like protein